MWPVWPDIIIIIIISSSSSSSSGSSSSSNQENVLIIQTLARKYKRLHTKTNMKKNELMQHSIVVRPTAVRGISTDIICQTIVQLCRTSDLELTATCSVTL